MQIWEAILYGAVQGLTEYLPISSSAHLILLPYLLKRPDPGLTFDVFLHLGTLAATLLYFRHDWSQLVRAVVARVQRDSVTTNGRDQSSGRVDPLWIVVGTIPALVAGGLLSVLGPVALKEWLRSLPVMMVSLSVAGVVLAVVDRRGQKSHPLERLGIRGAFTVGLAQCLALVPGVSRSGVTLTAGLGLGLTRAAAARFSFLLSAPVTAAAVVFELRHLPRLAAEISAGALGSGGHAAWVLAVACVSSFGFGWLAIDALIRLLGRFSLMGFAVYRVGLALVLWATLSA